MDAPVIIVGAGPVGLSLALGLARYGVHSILLEKRKDTVNESRAVVVWARTLEIMRDWNAYDALCAAGTFASALHASNARNDSTIVDVDFTKIADVVDRPGALLIPQYETERVLQELVARSGYCEIREGTEVTGITPSLAYVDVHARSDAGDVTLRGAYAIGCDGAHGVIRHAIGMTLEGMTYNSRIVLSDDIVADDRGQGAQLRAVLDRPGLTIAIRFAPGRWRVIASIAAGTSDEEALSTGAHRARLQRVFGPDVKTETVWVNVFNIHRRHAQRFAAGHVVLAGDAAHLNSPAGGQGMNAGIQDAANLAWKLASALTGKGDGDALVASYDVERREMVTDTVERFTDRLTRVGIGASPRVKQIAARVFSRLTRGRGMQRKLCRAMGMLSGRYTKSPIIDSRHPLAGRRIDDLLLPGGLRVNRVRNGDAALILAGSAELSGPFIRIPAPPKRWHVKGPAVLIVRPDGCVAAVVEKPTRERVQEAWQKAFCGTIPLPQVG